MIVIPAIDLLSGEVVRLRKGKLKDKKVYSKDPRLFVEKWKDKGARLIHVVDLDAALGIGNNNEVIKDLTSVKGVDLQVGGGIRNFKQIERLLKSGVKRFILGTTVFKDKDFFLEVLNRYSERVALALDMKGEMVAVRGWEETIFIDIDKELQEFEKKGLKWVIYTDVTRDGMLKGGNIDVIKKLKKKVNCNFIASGGISSIEDIRRIKENELWGVIVGKALYENKLDLKQAIKES